MIQILQVLLIAYEIILAALCAYLLLLALLSLFAPKRTRLEGAPTTRFAILIPAHNEERLLPDLLASLATLDYAADRCRVYVVADNCTDRTAEIARAAGVRVYTRFNAALGKGYALQWLIEQINAAGERYDACVILDADSVVSSSLLQVMDALLRQGADAIQGYYAVRDMTATWSGNIRFAALTLLHYLRPLGRQVLGLSPGLKGNGMCFTAQVIERFPWSASLTEDIEYHANLILAGRKVVFAPDAIVWAEMPGKLRDSHTQNVRWERGRLQMVRTYVPRLLRQGIRQRRWAPIDAALEQLIPPFSVFVGLMVLALVAGWVFSLGTVARLGWALLAGQSLYVLTGLIIAGAPPKTYLALLGAPFYMLWKIWLYVSVLVGRYRQGWVRTAREGDKQVPPR